ncbi:MAG: hypothetical protein IJX31_03255 [Clostridia bacterium]|nr:hypothetical protein [Clostridia bacterium]
MGDKKMERIIKKLYKIDLEQKILSSLKTEREKASQEWDYYNALYEESSEIARKLLLKYINVRAEREQRELEKVYACGFKTAMKLLIETFKE